MLNNFDKTWQTNTLKTTIWAEIKQNFFFDFQICILEIKQNLNKGDMYHVHELYDSILLRYHLYQNWSVAWLQSQNSSRGCFQKLTSRLKILYGHAKDLE